VITPDDDSGPGAHPVMVVSYSFWKNKLGENPHIVGQALRINNYPFTVIGVAPPGFYGDTVGDAQDFWAPVTMQEQLINGRKWLEDYNASWLHVIARLKPGVQIQQAKAELGAISTRLEQQYPEDDKGWGATLIPLSEQLVGDVRTALLVLLGAVAFVLLIACANVANLVLAKTMARGKELAIRNALGASRIVLLRHILAETMLLSVLGGVLGLLLARFGLAV